MTVGGSTAVLGISAFYHDSAAALVRDGEVVAAAQEERFSRRKHDAGFPENAVRYCLHEAGITAPDLTHVVFYDKPFSKFERLLETYVGVCPAGLRSFLAAIPVWVGEKLWLDGLIQKELGSCGDVLYAEHHESHAASAFYPSPFSRATVLTLDGVGEWATSSVALGHDNELDVLAELHFPHSLGLLYSAFTYYLGFKVNSGEYKVMGLAPYGRPTFVQKILDELIDLCEDGSFKLNLDYFGFHRGLRMTSRRLDQLFGGPPRAPESALSQREMDLARSIQDVVEEIVLRIARHWVDQTGIRNLCLAGGVALNCVANGKLLRSGIVDDIWIQPAAGDAGGALGAALAAWHRYLGKPRHADGTDDLQRGSYLGPAFPSEEARAYFDSIGAPYDLLEDEEVPRRTAELIAAGNVIGWHQGRMEFGPRALGGRSIIGDARSPEMQKVMNLKIKYRESFRPFAPSVIAEDVGKYFEHQGPSPYMLLVADVRDAIRKPMTVEHSQLSGIDMLNVPRSSIPAVTHVDYSARFQTVDGKWNRRFYEMLLCFRERTGCSVIVNTSFNVRGEPIVCTPEDSYRCFMRTEMDYLVVENLLLEKREQPPFPEEVDWRERYELD